MTQTFQQALAVQDKQPPLTDRGRRTRDNLLQSARTVFERRGSVFADRYHDRVLKTPREVRNALRYVLGNGRKHAAEGREVLVDEIKEEANDVLGYAPNPKKKNKRNRPEDDGPVLAVLFNQFIVQ